MVMGGPGGLAGWRACAVTRADERLLLVCSERRVYYVVGPQQLRHQGARERGGEGAARPGAPGGWGAPLWRGAPLCTLGGRLREKEGSDSVGAD